MRYVFPVCLHHIAFSYLKSFSIYLVFDWVETCRINYAANKQEAKQETAAIFSFSVLKKKKKFHLK